MAAHDSAPARGGIGQRYRGCRGGEERNAPQTGQNGGVILVDLEGVSVSRPGKPLFDDLSLT
ncbi:MAG TPA: hypothetical protein VHT30_07305, partial [Acidimicrobiales bacterium]|nr:hypothetical protein [Acidimicrobiales bacterium]